jgi:hypothetical protein
LNLDHGKFLTATPFEAKPNYREVIMKSKFAFFVLSLFLGASTGAAHAGEYKQVQVKLMELKPLTVQELAAHKVEPLRFPKNYKPVAVKVMELKPLTAEQLGFAYSKR